jgi:hypothetical protein
VADRIVVPCIAHSPAVPVGAMENKKPAEFRWQRSSAGRWVKISARDALVFIFILPNKHEGSMK